MASLSVLEMKDIIKKEFLNPLTRIAGLATSEKAYELAKSNCSHVLLPVVGVVAPKGVAVNAAGAAATPALREAVFNQVIINVGRETFVMAVQIAEAVLTAAGNAARVQKIRGCSNAEANDASIRATNEIYNIANSKKIDGPLAVFEAVNKLQNIEAAAAAGAAAGAGGAAGLTPEEAEVAAFTNRVPTARLTCALVLLAPFNDNAVNTTAHAAIQIAYRSLTVVKDEWLKLGGTSALGFTNTMKTKWNPIQFNTLATFNNPNIVTTVNDLQMELANIIGNAIITENDRMGVRRTINFAGIVGIAGVGNVNTIGVQTAKNTYNNNNVINDTVNFINAIKNIGIPIDLNNNIFIYNEIIRLVGLAVANNVRDAAINLINTTINPINNPEVLTPAKIIELRTGNLTAVPGGGGGAGLGAPLLNRAFVAANAAVGLPLKTIAANKVLTIPDVPVNQNPNFERLLNQATALFRDANILTLRAPNLIIPGPNPQNPRANPPDYPNWDDYERNAYYHVSNQINAPVVDQDRNRVGTAVIYHDLRVPHHELRELLDNIFKGEYFFNQKTNKLIYNVPKSDELLRRFVTPLFAKKSGITVPTNVSRRINAKSLAKIMESNLVNTMPKLDSDTYIAVLDLTKEQEESLAMYDKHIDELRQGLSEDLKLKSAGIIPEKLIVDKPGNLLSFKNKHPADIQRLLNEKRKGNKPELNSINVTINSNMNGGSKHLHPNISMNGGSHPFALLEGGARGSVALLDARIKSLETQFKSTTGKDLGPLSADLRRHADTLNTTIEQVQNSLKVLSDANAALAQHPVGLGMDASTFDEAKLKEIAAHAAEFNKNVALASKRMNTLDRAADMLEQLIAKSRPAPRT